MYKLLIRYAIAAGLLLGMAACSKVEYTSIDAPAYLRVFNNLNYSIGLANKDQRQPFLTMLIDPVMDADGVPVGAGIMGDFLDQRDWYAPPYPSHVGSSTSVNNPEYPGKENVLVGPVLNGFDLSSWAQIPSGKHRFMFMYRPRNTVPFGQLEAKLRNIVLLDTTITLVEKEVYTMHILQKDFETKENGILVRKEQFHKLPLSDSMMYVNFYNMSAKGFWNSDDNRKPTYNIGALLNNGIKDNANVWYSLFKGNSLSSPLPAYQFRFLTAIHRNTSSDSVATYFSIPLFADSSSNGIHTGVWQRFSVMAVGMDPSTNPYNDNANNTYGNYGIITCYNNGLDKPVSERKAWMLPNMLVNIHSGVYNPRSFATVNTIEIVNGVAYLTTIQRKYPPPVY